MKWSSAFTLRMRHARKVAVTAMPYFDAKSPEFRAATLNIERRAERQIYDERLVKCFVPNRVLEELETSQNQLIYGRRGVGKTHTMKAHLSRCVERGELCHYIDCTSFGSGLASDGTHQNVGIRFFSKFLQAVCMQLFEDIVRLEQPVGNQQEQLEGILARFEQLCAPGSNGETFNYAQVIAVTNAFLDCIGAQRLTVLIDEWAQIPLPSQPYFAEFLKRAFFANPRVTMKIGVVEFAYKLSERVNGQLIGLERSADIFSDIRMDHFFVWDEDKDFVERFFVEVLFNHLALQLNIDLGISSDDKLGHVMSDLFTQRRVFAELCRASEGNARDFLVIFGKAHGKFKQQTVRQNIGLDDVHNAAIALYRGDKYPNISSEGELEKFLDYLIHSVICNRKSRTFMVPYHLRNHDLLRRLYSARILHPLNLEWSHPDRPGERYNLVTMDYGTYASFKGTANEPEQQLFWETSHPRTDELDLVPLDDRRSIRRIVLEESDLQKFAQPGN